MYDVAESRIKLLYLKKKQNFLPSRPSETFSFPQSATLYSAEKAPI